jgi:putative FmdB family regulatory protein
LPIYEYVCRVCGKRFQYLVLKKEDEEGLRCPGCESRDLKKLISRAVFHVSEQDRLSTYNPNGPKDDAFYKDTRNIGLHAKKRAQQMGVDLGSGFESKLERLRTDPGRVFDENE